MLLYIIRHGVTRWNRLKKVQGSADIALAPEGMYMARKTGEALKTVPFDICFSSPLLRARQTAYGVLKDRKVPVVTDSRIQEINFGMLEGTRFKDPYGNVLNREMDKFFNDPMAFERPVGGENIADVLIRTKAFWDDITGREELQDKTVLVASHGCAVRALLQNLYQDPENFWHGCVPPKCSVNLIEVKNGQARFLEEDKVLY